VTETIDPRIDAAASWVGSIIWEPLTEVAVDALFVKVPWLGVWPLGPVVRFALKRFSELLFKKAKLAIDLGALRLLNAEAHRTFVKSVVVLKAIALRNGIESKEFLEAHNEAKLAFARFIRVRA
jgi:hypothetical protein